MTWTPVDKDAADAAVRFPAGGRPQEWRALEEASAFEKWFDQSTPYPSGHSQLPKGQSTPEQTAIAPLSHDASGAAIQRRAEPETIPMMTAGAAGSEPSMMPVDAYVGDRKLGAAASHSWPGKGAVDSELAVIEPRASTSRLSSAVLSHWSKTAVTAVVGERQVRVWMRDYDMTSREVEMLHRGLMQELQKLGYRLAVFVVNGQTARTQAVGDPMRTRQEFPES